LPAWDYMEIEKKQQNWYVSMSFIVS
jgi:hypothetical protein